MAPSGCDFTEVNIQRLFGHEAAEDEDPKRLRQYYFKSSVYKQVTADLPLRILVGHKGTGKSALFKVAADEETEGGRVAIAIRPNDIVDVPIDTTDFLRTIRSWRHGLTNIIIRKVLVYLGITKPFPGVEGNGQGIVGELSAFINDAHHDTDFDRGRQDSILGFLELPLVTVYIDDLDRGWEGRKEDIKKISALLNAVRDICTDERSLRFKIALRSDVYFLVRTSDESTDKIEGSVVWHTWANHEIFVLLIKRIETFFGRTVAEPSLLEKKQSHLAEKYLGQIMQSRFTGRGHWDNAPMYKILMSLIRKRPRDLVKLCTLAAKKAHEKRSRLILTEHFQSIFEEYSQGRMTDTVNEFKSELPSIEELLTNMKPNKLERTAKQGYVYSTAQLMKKIDNILGSHSLQFVDNRKAEREDLAAFMYKINFLTARRDGSDGIVRKYFEENRYLSSKFADFGFDWEIHPAYRWVLQPDRIEDIYDSLKLSADEE